jgi:hypothetical protein
VSLPILSIIVFEEMNHCNCHLKPCYNVVCIGFSRRTVLRPITAETWDGGLNDLIRMIVPTSHKGIITCKIKGEKRMCVWRGMQIKCKYTVREIDLHDKARHL